MSLGCPQCSAPLVPVSTPAGEACKCPRCGGCWMGLTVLRTLYVRESINAAWHESRFGSPAAGVSCPACRKPTADVALPGNGRISLCPSCQGGWIGHSNMTPAAG